MRTFRPFHADALTACLVVAALVGTLVLGSLPADAAKKAKAKDPKADAAKMEEEVKKELTPVLEKINKLMVKIQAHGLWSPTESGYLAEIKYSLMEINDKYPKSKLVEKSMFQAAIVYAEREAYSDAYDLYNTLIQKYPESEYTPKARGQIEQLKRQLPAGYFPADITAGISVEGAPPADAKKDVKPEAAAGNKK